MTVVAFSGSCGDCVRGHVNGRQGKTRGLKCANLMPYFVLVHTVFVRRMFSVCSLMYFYSVHMYLALCSPLRVLGVFLT